MGDKYVPLILFTEFFECMAIIEDVKDDIL